MTRTALIVTTKNWVPTARLATALERAGFVVRMLCPAGHPVGKTHVVSGAITYRGLTPLRSLARAIHATKPDVVVPGDDLATLDQTVLSRFRTDIETERTERVESTRLQLNAIRQIVSHLGSGARAGGGNFA